METKQQDHAGPRPVVDGQASYGLLDEALEGSTSVTRALARREAPPVVYEAPHASPPREIEFSPETIRILKATVMPGATDDELAFYTGVCKRTGLDPFAKQIHAVSRKVKVGARWVEKWSFQIAIDGFRLIAERTGKYRGQTVPLFCGADGEWREVWLSTLPPRAAKVGVLRSDFDAPLYAVALWEEYVQTKDVWEGDQRTGAKEPAAMWAKMPTVMLAKVAEALALRKAFPQEMSGLYTVDEMAQAENDRADADERGAKTVHDGDRAQGAATVVKVVEDPNARRQGVNKGAAWTGDGPGFAFGPQRGWPVNAIYDAGAIKAGKHGPVDVSGQFVFSDNRLGDAILWARNKLLANEKARETAGPNGNPEDVEGYAADDVVARLEEIVLTHGAELGRREALAVNALGVPDGNAENPIAGGQDGAVNAMFDAEREKNLAALRATEPNPMEG